MEWVAFLALIAVLLWVDLGGINKNPHSIAVPEALKQSAFWIGVSILFGIVAVWFGMGPERGSEFFTAYIIEKSLSVDNLFVFLAIFSYFQVADKYQHKVLYWGILGAVVLRFIAIAGGVSLLHCFHWLTYVFGAILVYTSWKVTFGDSDSEDEFDNTPFARFIQRHLPFDLSRQNGNFIYRDEQPSWDGTKRKIVEGRMLFTKLFFVLLIVEFTDLLFATDSIPAALACSNNAFVIFTSNILAVLGLRSLYFALSAMMGKFEYLKYGVGAVLALIGCKMLLAGVFTAPTYLWLIMVAVLLGTSVAASVLFAPKEAPVSGS